VAAGVVETGEDLLDHDPQFKYRRTFVELEYPGVGKYRTHLGVHFQLSKYTCNIARAPLLGEHNEYVFKEILGMPDDEFDKLVKEEVIY
jgi:crotonobetainyl-CoA:carnitine CoA-transferase CaiB-like acyl-CoA transferase